MLQETLPTTSSTRARARTLRRDQTRDKFFRSHRFRILRFGNRQTMEHMEWVLMEIGKVIGVTYE